jgi:hypothetical protein
MDGSVEGHTRDDTTRRIPDMPKASADRECWLKVTERIGKADGLGGIG